MAACLWRTSYALLKSRIFYNMQRAMYAMNVEEFRSKGKEVIDYICEYRDTIRCKKISPDVQRDFLIKCLPSEAPKCPENFDVIMKDYDEKVMPGIFHWSHPLFFGFFPITTSYPAILAEMFCDHSASVSFGGWSMCPAAVEMEQIALDMFAKALGLPNFFLHECGTGGGVINSCASECILSAMLVARHKAIKSLKCGQEEKPDNCFLHKLVAYLSEDTHSCGEKAASICMVKKRLIETDERYRLRGCPLEKAIEEDIAQGLVPFFVISTVGTTNMTACDKLSEIAQVCRRYPNIWIHVDGAYGGNSLVCPEFRYLMEGIECADSFNCNPHKWLLSLMDCSTMYFKDINKVKEVLHVYRPIVNTEGDDYGDWSLSLSRRFRALKLWYVLRSYGIEGLQLHIRTVCCLAKCFKALVKQDNRFEVLNDVRMGLVCFRLCENNEINKQLLESINCEGQIYLTPTMVKHKYILRLSINYDKSTEEDMHTAWNTIKRHAENILKCKK